MSKHGWLVLLVGVNLALLAGIWLKAWQPWAAQAQAFGGANPYLIVTGKSPAGNSAAVYVVDISTRMLVVFQPDPQFNIQILDQRDLARDFGRNAGGGPARP